MSFIEWPRRHNEEKCKGGASETYVNCQLDILKEKADEEGECLKFKLLEGRGEEECGVESFEVRTYPGC